MAHKKVSLSEQESRLIKALRSHPELVGPLEELLQTVQPLPGQPLAQADEVEDQVVEIVRQLGGSALAGWAGAAEAEAGRQLKQEDPSLYPGKKKR